MSAQEILSHLDMDQGTATAREIRLAWTLADDGGMIQADGMLRLFPGAPHMHGCCTLTRALRSLGCKGGAS